MNPLLIKGILAAVLLGAAAWVVEAIPAHYIAVGVAQANAARAVSDAAHLAADTKSKADAEAKYAVDLYAEQTKRIKGEQDHAKNIAAAVAVARAGSSGMRCPGTTIHADTPPATSAAIPGPGEPEGQQLVPAAAGDILDIAAGIARNVRDYNALLAEHQRAMAVCKSDPARP